MHRGELEPGLGRDQHAVAAALDRGAKDFLGSAAGIDIGAVKHGQASVKADIDKARSFGRVSGTSGFEEITLAAEGAGAKGQDGNLKAGLAEAAVFHGGSG